VSECHLRHAFRKEAGLIRSHVALRLGVTQQTCSTQERKTECVGVADLLKLLGNLGVELVLSKPTSSASAPGVSPQARPVHQAGLVTRMERRFPTRSLGLWMNGADVGSWSLGKNGPLH
jgi:HTH-type transcriptional regulator/antitoxin HipB